MAAHAANELTFGASRIITAPVARAKQSRVGRPKIASNSNQADVSHSEYVCDLMGSVAFTTVSFTVNPGEEKLLSWLSALAKRYEKYQFKKLTFRIEPTCGTSTVGSVVVTFDHDVEDSPPSDKKEALAASGAVRTPPWSAISYSIPPALLAKRGQLNTKSAFSRVKESLLHDLGRVHISTEGMADASAVGEIFVDYTVSLSIPQGSNTLASTVKGDASYTQAGASMTNLVDTGEVKVEIKAGFISATPSKTALVFKQHAEYNVEVWCLSTSLLWDGVTPLTLAATDGGSYVPTEEFSSDATAVGGEYVFVTRGVLTTSMDPNIVYGASGFTLGATPAGTTTVHVKIQPI